jgi:molybdate/tungstate transport system substrate-binding protein
MAKRFVILISVVALVAGLMIGHFAWTTGATIPRTETLTIYHAGSLAEPLKDLAEEFERTHPNVDVLLESGGSNEMINKWLSNEAAGEAPPDIMASADYTLIPDRTYEDGYADWYIAFAKNKIVLCYTDSSDHATEVAKSPDEIAQGKTPWYEILQMDDVKYGHSDPDLDPCGYRALMVIQLAEAYYYDRATQFSLTPDDDADGLYATLIGGTDDPQHSGRPQYAHEREYVSQKSVDLISLLRAGELDYAFEYRSVAVQSAEQGIKFIELADAINLSATGPIPDSSPAITYEEFYKTAEVDILTAPDEYATKKGKPIVYGLTIPKNAENPQLAMEFIVLLLSNTGKDIFEVQNGQPFLTPTPLCDHPENLPTPIKEGAP